MHLSLLLPLLALPLIRGETRAGQKSGLTITTYVESNCEGEQVLMQNVLYSANYSLPAGLVGSYKLSRTLDPSEQLDWSTIAGSDDCGKYQFTAQDAQQGGTCWTMNEMSACFRFWHH